jgi:hypothetical protein
MESPKKLFLLLSLLLAAVLLPVSSASASAAAKTRVIVTLAVPAAADQSAAISQATDALLASLPGGDYTVTNRYTAVPYVAISAGPATLAVLSVLQQSGLVAAIERDVTVTAASSGKKCKTVKASKKGKRAKKCPAAPAVH